MLKGYGKTGNEMYDLAIESMMDFREELERFMESTVGEIDARYVAMLIRGYTYNFEHKARREIGLTFEGSEEDFVSLRRRLEEYMGEFLWLYDEVRKEQEYEGEDGSGVLPAYVSLLSERKDAFEDAAEYELYMRTFLGNWGFRENVVRTCQVRLWRGLFDAFREEHFDRMDYVLMMNVIEEVEKCLVWCRDLWDTSERVETWNYRSVMSENVPRYEKWKRTHLEDLLRQVDFVVEMFSTKRS